MKKRTQVLKTEAQYLQLAADLAKVEQAKAVNGRALYLLDENVDDENVMDGGDVERFTPEYWHQMYNACGSSSGQRAEEYGFSINEALGYTVY